MKPVVRHFRILPLCLSALLFTMQACKGKEKPAGEGFFPVASFLKSQVAMVDTSLYSIMRLTAADSGRYDTAFISREKFRDNAVEFLSIPDLSESDFSDRYRETKQFDEGLNLVILTYEPLKPEKEVIQRQQVTIKPGIGGDKVKNIIINLVSNSKDSSVQKNLLWNADQSFQVATIKQLPGQPETSSNYKVTWNESE